MQVVPKPERSDFAAQDGKAGHKEPPQLVLVAFRDPQVSLSSLLHESFASHGERSCGSWQVAAGFEILLSIGGCGVMSATAGATKGEDLEASCSFSFRALAGVVV